jgi:hypothetical protein
METGPTIHAGPMRIGGTTANAAKTKAKVPTES